MKSILVPTDFSEFATNAFETALAIAQKTKVPVTLLHIAGGEQPAESQLPENKLQQQVEGAHQKGFDNVIINTHVADGSVVPAILNAIETYAADLVVMGTKGASGIKKVFMGSNAANVISKAPVPVLTIPAARTSSSFHNIVLAINDSEEDLHNLSVLFELADAFNARVQLAIFSDQNAEAVDYVTDRRAIIAIQNKLQSLYQKDNLEVEHLSGANFEDTLQAYLTDNKADLLAMITHKRGLIDGLFNRSITRQMAYHATLPLLSIHGRQHSL